MIGKEIDKLFEKQKLDSQILYNRKPAVEITGTSQDHFEFKRKSKPHKFYNADDATAFFNELWDFQALNENSIVMEKGKKTSIYLSAMKNSITRNNLFKHFWAEDLYYTPNTFSPCGNKSGCARTNNLFRVVCWAIDVDYKKIKGNEHKDPSNYWNEYLSEAVYDKIIPYPSFIEYGHQLRLIYILKEPINCKNGKKLMKAIHFIQDMLCKALNAAYNCNAERQTLSSYFRVPGSINEKSGDRIEIMKISSERYTVQELMDEYLPVYVKKEKMPKKEQHRRAAYKSMCITLQTDRIDYYKKARRIPGITRENLCFLFAVAQKELFGNKDLMDKILEFNEGFPQPLPKKELKSKMHSFCENDKRYKYDNETIMSKLELDSDTCKQYDIYLYTTKKEMDHATLVKEERTRELHRAKFEKEVMDAIKNGPIDKKSLAKKMNVSARTITRYLNTVLEKIGNTKSSKTPKMAAIISSIKALIKEPCEEISLIITDICSTSLWIPKVEPVIIS